MLPFFGDLSMPSASPDPQVAFDRKLALYHAGDEPEVLRAVVVMFLDQVDERIELLETAVRERDAVELERMAHALKGTAATLALARVRDAAHTLEELGTAGRTSEAPDRCAELREALDEVLPALREMVSGGE